ncbi:MAG: hypothetical protein CENE_02753 [Candidatus Celerinatantimonas neptuna]|nr:MAG: hypothetical protein CENE_02753 [Candidatus Celerinatantimonas neptuna]
MEIYSTEEQQMQVIQNILHRYWGVIVALVIVVLIAIGGWYFYQSRLSSKTLEASAAYQKTLVQYAKDGHTKPEVLEQFAKTYQGDGSYPQFAQLLYVQKLVQQKNYQKAEGILKETVKVADEPVKSFAQIRLARIQAQLKQYDNALSTLGQVNEKVFKGVVASLQGDIWVDKGNFDKARNAYRQALADGDGSDPTLQQKIDNLAGE